MRELGEQLAVHEAGLFRQIVPSELQGMAFSKKATKAERAPNVLRMIGHFNRMTRWVCTQIVKQPTAKERARCLRLFISLAKVSRELGNFNGLMEVVAALNSAAVFRLKRTWELLPRASAKEFSELDDLVKPQRSHAALRRAIGEGHREASVPYLGLYLTDLTFIEDGNPNFLSPEDDAPPADGSTRLVNLAKTFMLGKAIGEILAFQRTLYPFSETGPVLLYFSAIDPPEDDEIYALSLACEPRDGEGAPAARPGSGRLNLVRTGSNSGSDASDAPSDRSSPSSISARVGNTFRGAPLSKVKSARSMLRAAGNATVIAGSFAKSASQPLLNSAIAQRTIRSTSAAGSAALNSSIAQKTISATSTAGGVAKEGGVRAAVAAFQGASAAGAVASTAAQKGVSMGVTKARSISNAGASLSNSRPSLSSSRM